VVVDQATDEAARMRERINDPAIVELEPIRSALMKLCGETSGDVLGISTLRGQFEDNAEWRGNPSRPAVIVGTVDMVGSRLLFSGYGVGFKTKPLHAGFLGQDAQRWLGETEHRGRWRISSDLAEDGLREEKE
jgi:CRISPR-associated endonuclease/helicase Cas3